MKPTVLLCVGVLTALLTTGLTACGSDGPKPGSDEARITDLARALTTAPVNDAVCRASFTDDFVARVFGDVEGCVTSGTDDEPGDNATEVKVSDIRVDGEDATAVVTETGGASDGATGTWAFTRDAAGWRVSDWRIDYLRADFKAQFGAVYRPAGNNDPFTDPTVRACVSEKLQGLADAEFRATVYEIIRRSGGADEALKNWYYDCIGGDGADGGVSTLRRLFEDGLRQAEQIPPDVIECVVAKLRKTVSDKEIRAMGESGASKTPPAVEKRISKATVTCVDEVGS